MAQKAIFGLGGSDQNSQKNKHCCKPAVEGNSALLKRNRNNQHTDNKASRITIISLHARIANQEVTKSVEELHNNKRNS